MNPTPHSQLDAPDTGCESMNLDECDDLTGRAKELIDGHHAGVLATVGDDGAPRLRWMSTFSFEDFPKLLTLTSANSAKVRQIQRCSKVTWMFSNDDLSLVLHLAGTARILTDAASIRRARKRITDTSHAYFLRNFSESLEIAVIETTVGRIDCTLPQSGLKWSQFVAEPEPKRRPAARRAGGAKSRKRG